MEPYDVLDRSIAQTRTIVARITPEHYDLSTPCGEWNVREVLDHLLGALVMWESLASGQGDMAVLGADHAGDDPPAAYDRVAAATLGAWSADGVVAGTVAFPGSELPGAFAARMLAGDVIVHGWDLARATGQEGAWDQELATDLLAWHDEAKDRWPPETRAQAFGPEVAVPHTADSMTRLLGVSGRHA